MTDVINSIQLIAMFLVCFSGLGLLIITHWRWSILILGLQYLGVFILIMENWPFTLALVKLVAGWMAGAIIGLALTSSGGDYRIKAGGVFIDMKRETSRLINPYRLFRLFTAGLVSLIVVAYAPSLSGFLPEISLEQSLGAFFLIGFGILQLSLTADLLLVILGLLTTLSGFEIIYAVIESSSLVNALLATVTLGIAFVGATMISISNGDASQ